MSDPFFFGYGSLVNRATHAYGVAHTARVVGWRRAWRHTGQRDLAFLSAEPAPGVEIEGLIAQVPGGDWSALDIREHGYQRHPIKERLAHAATRSVSAQIYAIPPARGAEAGRRHPILLSYLDVVVQGYLREFGEAGAERFFVTTTGWEAPVLDDRTDPRYPRHQRLTPSERGFVDDQLVALGMRIIRG